MEYHPKCKQKLILNLKGAKSALNLCFFYNFSFDPISFHKEVVVHFALGKKEKKDTNLGVKLPQCVFMAFSC